MKYIKTYENINRDNYLARVRLTRAIFNFLQNFNIKKLNLGSKFTIKIGSYFLLKVDEFNAISIRIRINILPPNYGISEDLYSFLQETLDKYSFGKRKSGSNDIGLSIEDVDEVISNLTLENYQFYVDTNKYNL